MRINNLKDLRDYLNTLNDEQLQGKPFVNRTDEFTHSITEVMELEEDHFLGEESLEPISTFEPNDDGDLLSNYEIYPAGYVFFSADDEEELADPLSGDI